MYLYAGLDEDVKDYVECARTGRKRLAMKTFYKTSPPLKKMRFRKSLNSHQLFPYFSDGVKD